MGEADLGTVVTRLMVLFLTCHSVRCFGCVTEYGRVGISSPPVKFQTLGVRRNEAQSIVCDITARKVYPHDAVGCCPASRWQCLIHKFSNG